MSFLCPQSKVRSIGLIRKHALDSIPILTVHPWFVLMLFMTWASPSGTAVAQTVHLPLGHWSYDLLDRFDAKGLFNLVGYDAKPLTRQEVVDIIRQVSQNPTGMTATEQALFEELKGEFTDELTGTMISVADEEREPHLAGLGQPDKRLFLDGRLNQRTELIGGRNNQHRNRMVIGVRGRGRYKNIVAFSGEVRLRIVNGVGPVGITVERSRGLLSSIHERNARNVEYLGSLVFRYRWFRFYFGKGRNRWGPALRSFPIVSDQMPSYPMVKAIFNLWGLKYTYFHGFLINDGSDHVPGHPLVLPQKRYWAGNRLDFKFWEWFRFSAMETVVYGDRNLELLYLFPVTTFNVGELILDGDDKRNISFDGILRLPYNIKLYSQLLISDWWIEKYNRAIRIFTDSSARWAIIGGIWILDPGGLENTDFRIEYTRIEPFVYTQRFPWNVYQYQLRPLGTFLEPNSDNMFFEIRYRPHREWFLAVHGQVTRHSDTPVDGIGDGSIYGQEDVGLGTRKKNFLGGVMEHTLSGGFRVRREIHRRQFLEFQYSAVRVRPVDFPNQISGAIAWDHRLMLNVSLDY